jgi:hypothetical protein
MKQTVQQDVVAQEEAIQHQLKAFLKFCESRGLTISAEKITLNFKHDGRETGASFKSLTVAPAPASKGLQLAVQEDVTVTTVID